MKKKINIIDIVVILAILLVAAVVVFKFVINSTKNEDNVTITYTVLVESIYPEVAEQIVPVNEVLLDSKDNVYGKIKEVNVKDAENWFLNQLTEEYVHSTFDGRKDVEIIIEAKAVEKEYGYMVGQQNVRVGEVQNITTSQYSAVGHIVEIND